MADVSKAESANVADVAERALRAFGGQLSRETAVRLLPMWKYYRDLLPEDRNELLARFRPQREWGRP